MADQTQGAEREGRNKVVAAFGRSDLATHASILVLDGGY
jgi:hypothetical protein